MYLHIYIYNATPPHIRTHTHILIQIHKQIHTHYQDTATDASRTTAAQTSTKGESCHGTLLARTFRTHMHTNARTHLHTHSLSRYGDGRVTNDSSADRHQKRPMSRYSFGAIIPCRKCRAVSTTRTPSSRVAPTSCSQPLFLFQGGRF